MSFDPDTIRAEVARHGPALRFVLAAIRGSALRAAGAEHLIATSPLGSDLARCHALLGVPAAGSGLIGSASRWAWFRSRLRQLGHADSEIARSIGDPNLGKHPQAIAVGVAAALLTEEANRERQPA